MSKSEFDAQLRSCVTKRRYKVEPPLPNMTFYAYRCSFCQGWHLAKKRDAAESRVMRNG